MKDIIYGIRKIDGKVISIDEIPDNMSGLSCGCKCASCGIDLQACSLKGKVRRYFRHDFESSGGLGNRNIVNCNSNTANETALHLLAKQIIFDEKKIFIPHKNISLSEAGIDLPEHIENSVLQYELRRESLIDAQSVELEKHLTNFTPDIYFKTNYGELLIEILVSHSVDEEKRKKAEMYGAAMLEIDLSEYINNPIITDELREIVVYAKANKSWKYYPISSANILCAKNYYESLSEVREYRSELVKEEQLKQKKIADSERRNKKIKELFEPKRYAAELCRLRSDTAFLNYWADNKKSYWFDFEKYYENTQSVPFFVDIPITGEMIFQCDRRIWQSILFNRFIYGRKNDKSTFDTAQLFDVLKKDYKIVVDYDLTYKLPDPIHDQKNIWLRRDVVLKYMYYLEKLGFIWEDETLGTWRKVMARKTIDVPKKETANRLIAAIQKVDSYSPLVNDLILEELREYFEEVREANKKKSEKLYRWSDEQIQQIQESNRMSEPAQSEEEKLESERAKKQQQEKRIYDDGLIEISNADFFKPIVRHDKYGNRWVKCRICSSIKRDYEMAIYTHGLGECHKCTSTQPE